MRHKRSKLEMGTEGEKAKEDMEEKEGGIKVFAPEGFRAFQKKNKCQPAYIELVPSIRHKARTICEAEGLR